MFYYNNLYSIFFSSGLSLSIFIHLAYRIIVYISYLLDEKKKPENKKHTIWLMCIKKKLFFSNKRSIITGVNVFYEDFFF